MALKQDKKTAAADDASEVVRIRVPTEVARRLEMMSNADVADILFNFVQKQYRAMEPTKPLLQRANELISGERQRDYGSMLQNFSQVAMLWQGVLATKLAVGHEITPEDVTLLMIQLKVARLVNNLDHEDSLLDVAGWAGCYAGLQADRKTGRPLKGATRDVRNTRGYYTGPDAGN